MRVIGIYFVFLVPSVFCATFSAYYITSRKNVRLGILLALLTFASMVIFLTYVTSYFQIGDEVYISFMSIPVLLGGHNPYQAIFAQQMYANFSKIGGTITMNNELVDRVNYPALYIILSAPFYFISKFSIYNIGHVDMKVETTIFFFVLIFGGALLLNNRRISKFDPGFLIIFAFMAATVANPIEYLMIFLLLVAYVKLESKFAFVLLGLGLSMQEEIWVPIILLLIYRFNNGGFGNGMRLLAGALLVFLLVNGIFIAWGPRVYFSNIFTPIGNLLPFGITAGAPILLVYHVASNASEFLFVLMTTVSAMLLLIWNRKSLIPLLSMLPFLVLFHSLTGYYTLYLFFAVFALLMVDGNDGHSGHITSWIKKNRRFFYTFLLFIILIGLFELVGYHKQYVSNFDIDVRNQSVSYMGNDTIYNAQLQYSNVTNDTMYLYLQGYSNHTFLYALYGVNQSLLGEGPECNDSYTCYMNYNRIVLNGNSGTYHLHAVIQGSSVSDRVTYMHAILYDSNYVYYTENVGNSSAYAT